MMLYLVRHGESLGNVRNQVTGHRDDPLSPKGEEQCRLLGGYIKNKGFQFTHAYVSHMARAQQTAQIVLPGAQCKVCDEIAETYAGECCTWTNQEFDERYPDFWTNFESARAYLGGESHLDLYNRVTGWLAELLETHDSSDRVIVFTHSGPIACILHLVFDVPLTHYPRFIAPNASITRIDWNSSLSRFSSPVLVNFGITG